VSSLPRVLLVTDRHRVVGGDLVGAIRRAIEGGIRFVQIRERDLPDGNVRAIAVALLRGAPPDLVLAVNARVLLARELAIGLHLPAATARPVELGGSPCWGRSAHDEAEVRVAAAEQGGAYLVLGTVFTTLSKPGLAGSGIEGLRRLGSIAGGRPVYAIGGIKRQDVAPLLAAGIHGVAVCGAILGRSDPHRAAKELVEEVSAVRALPP
jgi:thiamine-phosphate pyrophosphorylase